MKKNTRKLEEHLIRHPTDAAGVISLLKAKSHNYEYDFLLANKRKKERFQSMKRNEGERDETN
ncbi:hypothetical protein FI615_001708 [Enterococcus faecium]|uniref:hypothetical protein n=1 Tax=Enterococcus faecium TaxID=1352 RepID=UPI0019244BF6|nr:hypothetical protein [Enterococcus faecium]EGP4894221.1 hypothetical protein [Enterococcus faecium]EHK9936777.1 hypothetical protein [Enterococcus faecium]MBL3708369.1 hypothetical protein [Enterococcus faecium]